MGRSNVINHERASQIAVEKLKFHPQECGYLTVWKVALIDEISRALPNVYCVGNESMEDCWIIYFDQRHFVGLGSSTIMLVSRTTGAVVYFGSANDEG
jgi:hypothetical protein